MRYSLLIVDDEPLMVELITGFMGPTCSMIASTGDLHDAIEMARSAKFNLILLDLKLAKTGKEEAFAAIRTLKSFGAAVIVISGIPDLHLKEDALAAGSDGFISKSPDFTAQTLLLAANVAVLHLPKENFKSDSFLGEITLLHQTVHAA